MNQINDKSLPKVAIVLPWGPENQGGVTGVVTQLIAHWPSEEGLQPMLVVDDWSYPKPEVKKSAVYFRFSSIGQLSALGIIKSIIKLPWLLYSTWRFLKKFQIKAVNFHYPRLLPLSVVLLKKLNIYQGRLVVSYHGTDVFYPNSKIENFLHTLILNSADNIVACSNGLADRIAKTFSINRSTISTFYNGVDASIFHKKAPQSKKFDGGIPEKFIISVGAFIKRKSQQTLIAAFAKDIASKFPDYHLCLAGADGECREQLQNQVKSLGISDRVHFYIQLNQTEVAYLLSKSSLCVQTALAESFPLAILEAGACGAPIIASRISGHDELIFENKTGYLFEVDNAEDCSRVIERALKNIDNTLQMAETLHQDIICNYSWEACVAQYLNTYHGTLHQ